MRKGAISMTPKFCLGKSLALPSQEYQVLSTLKMKPFGQQQ